MANKPDAGQQFLDGNVGAEHNRAEAAKVKAEADRQAAERERARKENTDSHLEAARNAGSEGKTTAGLEQYGKALDEQNKP